jgi:tetratricopeptide (TPR) repeat protein
MKHFGLISVAALGLLCIFTLAGCRQGAHYRADLLRADSVMDARPDSAYGIVARLRPDSLDDANRALLCLLTTQAKWKTFQDVKRDTAWDAAIRHFTEQGDEDRLAKCYYYKGVVCTENDEKESAISNLLRAESLIKKTGDAEYKTLIYLDIGKFLCNNDLTAEALPYFNAVIQMGEKTKDFRKVVDALCCQSYYYDDKKAYDSCIIGLNSALKLVEKYRLDSYRNNIYNGFSATYFSLKNFKRSIYYSNLCLEILNNDTTQGNYYYSHVLLGDCFFELHQDSLSKVHFLEAINSPFYDARLDAYNHLFELEKKAGHYALAKVYKDKSEKVRISYWSNEKKAKIANTRFRFAMESERSEQMAEKRSSILLIIVLFLVLCLVSVLFIKMFICLKRYVLFKRTTKHLFDEFVQEKTIELKQSEKQYESSLQKKGIISTGIARDANINIKHVRW